MEKLGETMQIYTDCNECVNIYSLETCGFCKEGNHYTKRRLPHFENEFELKPVSEILEEECCQKVDEASLDSPEHPANQELLPELDAFNLEQIQNYNNTILKQLAKPHGRTHYYKFTLDFCEDYSIRFFLEFSDRKDYEQNWYLKSHKLKEHTLLTKEMAEDLIRKSCTTFVEEIIGRRSGKKYEKIVVSKDKLVKFTE